MVLLSHFGTEDAVSIFTVALTNEYNGKHLSDEESAELEHWAQRLGILSRRYPSALKFLLAGTQLGFWDKHRLWTTKQNELVNPRLVKLCVGALGVADGPKALAHLESIRNSTDTAYTKLAHISVVDAFFYKAMIKKHGYDFFFDHIIGINCVPYMVEWRKTPEGKSWMDWSARIRKMK